MLHKDSVLAALCSCCPPQVPPHLTHTDMRRCGVDTVGGGASPTVSEKCGVCLSSLVSLPSLTLFVHAGVLSLCLSLCTPCSTEHVVRRNKGGFEVLAGCPRCPPKECCKRVPGSGIEGLRLLGARPSILSPYPDARIDG